MTVLKIDSSIRGDDSVSRALSATIAQNLADKHGTTIVERDLARNDIPFVDEKRFAANLTPYAERTPEHHDLSAIADTLIGELQDADAIVFGIPIYNFSVPATVKAWADMVARAGTTFEYTATGPKGLLTSKKAYIALASGGTPAGSDMDFASSWLKFFLGFLGITDLEMVAADGIMGEGGEDTIRQAKETASRMAA